MDEDLKRMVEAILFAAGRKLELSDIAKLCKRPEQDILDVLNEWKSQLDTSESSTMLLQDGTGWKLTIREKYIGVIKKVVSKTELPKGHMETLAVVAYKAPVIQSKVVKIRTNKAYDHLSQLENSGFITREKSGRSKMIKLTPKFFEYFDIDPSKLKQKFSSSGDVEKAIEAKELEIENFEVEQRKQTGERLGTAQIVLHPDKGAPKALETYPSVEPVEELLPTGVEVVEEKIGDLPVYDVPVESLPPEERPIEHPHKVHHKKQHKKHPHAVHHERKEKVVEEVVEEKIEVEVPKSRESADSRELENAKRSSSEPEKVEEVKIEEKVEVLTPAEKISKEAAEKTKTLKGKKFEEGKGLYPKGVPPEMETKIEEKIKRMLSGEEEKKEE